MKSAGNSRRHLRNVGQNEALALDYVIPFRVITPEPRAGGAMQDGLQVDPFMMENGDTDTHDPPQFPVFLSQVLQLVGPVSADLNHCPRDVCDQHLAGQSGEAGNHQRVRGNGETEGGHEPGLAA